MTQQTPAGEYDLVVVGCGAAGLSAAVSYAAHHTGEARIAVLERADEENRGGATRWTSSWFRITEDRRLDPKFRDEMAQASKGLADTAYCRRLEREIPDSLDFLEKNGVDLIYFKQPFANRNTGGGLGMPAGGGKAIVDGLANVVDGLPGAEVLYETEAVRLTLSEDGVVDGLVVRGRDGRFKKLAAGAVVIACGGFEGNPEMLTRYLGDRAWDMPVIAPTVKNNRGDGVRMTAELGADTAGQFDMFHGEPADPRSTKPDPVIYGYPFGIVVNGAARRFFDEGQDSFDATFEALAYEIWRNQDQTAFFIGDQRTLGIDNFDQINLTDQPPVTGASLGELAEKLGIDAAALEATVAEYNAAVAPGEFDPKTHDGKAARGIDPPKSNWALPVDSPPYIAYPLTCAITFTFGGVRTDDRARVVSPAGAPIPGLFAAGEVTGLYYNRYPAGTSVLRAVTFGRIAAEEAWRMASGSPEEEG